MTATTADQRHVAVGFDGANYLVLWRDRQAPVGVYGARVRASDGQQLDSAAFPIQPGPDDAQPAVAFDGTNNVVVWIDSGRVVGTRVRASDRMVLDGAPVVMAPPPSGTGNRQPAIDYDGTNFMVLWRELQTTGQEHLRARRFGLALAAVGDVVALANNQGDGWEPASSQALSFGEGKHLALWTQIEPMVPAPVERYTSFQMNLQRALLDGAGASTVPVENISRSASVQDKPTLSFDGRHHLLAWQEWNGTKFDIRMVRLRGADGELLDSTSRVLAAAAPDNQFYPRSASNGSVHLVVWGDRLQLKAARVRGDDGTVLDAQPLVLPGSPGVWAYASPRWAVASDGTDFFVAWFEGVDSSTPIKLLGARIRASDGAILDTTARMLVDASRDPRVLSLAFAGGHYFAVWSDSTSSTSGLSVFGRRIGRDGAPVGTTLVLAGPAQVGYNYPAFPGVVSAGDVALAFWEWTFPSQLRGRRVRGSDGMILDAGEVNITPTTLATWSSEYRHSVAVYDGEHFLITWSTTENRRSVLKMTRVTLDGQVLDPDGFPLSVPQDWPAHDAALSAGPGTRVLASYVRHSALPSMSNDRVHWRWLGQVPTLPPDAGAPPVDAPVVPPVDAPVVPPVDAPVVPPVDAPVVPPVDAAPVDAGAGPDQAGSDTGDNLPDVAPASDVAPTSDATPTPDAVARDTGAEAPRDTRADARGDAAGGDEEVDCDCQLGGARAPAPPLAWLLGLAVVALRRRGQRGGRARP